MTQYQTLETDVSDRVCLVRFKRPERLNALSPELVRELRSVCEGLQLNNEVGAIVFAGDDRAFSSGADLKEPTPQLWTQEINDTFNRLEDLSKPTIAAISGWCIAGGLELAMACDLRVAAESAKIGDWHVKINSIGGAGATVRMVRLIGLSRAKELVFTGAAIDGQEAWRIGLVNRVCPPLEWLDTALALAKEIASQNQLTLAHSKRSMNAAADLELHRAIEYSLQLQETLEHRLGDQFGAALYKARRADRKPHAKF